jgi:hypothetical protein
VKTNLADLFRLVLLQNTFIVSASKVSFVSAHQVDTIYTTQKGGLFSIGWLKTADTNKCHVSKALLVSAGLGRPTPLSFIQIENNI